MKAALATYLASIPDGAAKSDGVKLGEAIAAKVVARGRMTAPMRPMPTGREPRPASMYRRRSRCSSMWPNLKPFAMANPSQFRPGPPISLESKEWAADFQRDQDYGGQSSAKRTAQQTETARFWLVGSAYGVSPVYTPARDRKADDVVDSARFMALMASHSTTRHRRAGRQIPLQFLAADHGHSHGDIDGNRPPIARRHGIRSTTPPMHRIPVRACIQSSSIAASSGRCSEPRTSPRSR